MNLGHTLGSHVAQTTSTGQLPEGQHMIAFPSPKTSPGRLVRMSALCPTRVECASGTGAPQVAVQTGPEEPGRPVEQVQSEGKQVWIKTGAQQEEKKQ